MLRIEKKQHVCSVALCNTITECYMITKLSGYVNAVYLCPDCLEKLIEFKAMEDKAKDIKPVKTIKEEPIIEFKDDKVETVKIDESVLATDGDVEPVKITKKRTTKK